MKFFLCSMLFLVNIGYAQEPVTKDHLLGKWTLAYGEKYGSFNCGNSDESRSLCDTTDCKEPWNYEFLKMGVIRFFDRDKDSLHTGKWALRNSLLTITFDKVITTLPLTKISGTRLETVYTWIDPKDNTKQETFLHMRRNKNGR